MGFPLAKVQEALSKVENASDFDAVLNEFLALQDSESPVPQAEAPPTLGRALSVESAAPDMPTLERQLSGNSRRVLQMVLSERGMGSVKEATRQLLALSAAFKQGLLSESDRRELQDHIRAGHVDVVRDIVAGIGVRESPEMMLPRGTPAWQCLVCRDQQQTHGWKCPSGHQFCTTCMQQHVDTVSFPKCPMCDYVLGESDFEL